MGNNIKMSLKKWNVIIQTGLNWFRQGQVADSCELGNELPSSIKAKSSRASERRPVAEEFCYMELGKTEDKLK